MIGPRRDSSTSACRSRISSRMSSAKRTALSSAIKPSTRQRAGAIAVGGASWRARIGVIGCGPRHLAPRAILVTGMFLAGVRPLRIGNNGKEGENDDSAFDLHGFTPQNEIGLEFASTLASSTPQYISHELQSFPPHDAAPSIHRREHSHLARWLSVGRNSSTAH
jgi:hypothetical protein